MSVTNGQTANATTFNNAFLSKSTDGTTTAIITLDAAASGGTISNLQSKVNTIEDDLGTAETSIASAQVDIVSLQSLSGVADEETDLGTFTGSIIPDDSDIKESLQALETELEDKKTVTANDNATGANATLTAIASSVVRLINASLTSVDMIPAPITGRVVHLINRTGVEIVLNDETGGTAANRIVTGTGDDLSIATDASVTLVYDMTTARWQVVGGTGSGLSSGSVLAVVQWYEGENSPALNTINEMQCYSYGDGLGQKLYAEMKIPSSYSSGRQISVLINHYSADSANTFLLQTVSTLIRNNTDVITSTTNQRTSTNSAITASGANQDKIQTATCDLTSASGQINAVNVSAGDTIKFYLTRGTDTLANEIIFLPKQTEVILV